MPDVWIETHPETFVDGIWDDLRYWDDADGWRDAAVWVAVPDET